MVQQSKAVKSEQKRAEMKRHVDSWKKSGLSAPKYGQQHGLTKYQLYYWNSKLAMGQSDPQSDSFQAKCGFFIGIFGVSFSIITYYTEFFNYPTIVVLLFLLFLACFLTYYVFKSFTGKLWAVLKIFSVILCIAVLFAVLFILFPPWSSIENFARSISWDRLSSYAMNRRIQDDLVTLRFSGFMRGEEYDAHCRKEKYPDIYQAAKFEIWRTNPPPWPSQTIVNFFVSSLSPENWEIIRSEVNSLYVEDKLEYPGTPYPKNDKSIERRNIELNSKNLGCEVIICGKHEKETQSITNLYKNVNLTGIKVNLKD